MEYIPIAANSLANAMRVKVGECEIVTSNARNFVFDCNDGCVAIFADWKLAKRFIETVMV